MAIYGTLTKSGRLSRHPNHKTRLRTDMFLEQLVRFDLQKLSGKSLLSDNEICKVLGISYRQLNRLRSHHTYITKRVELTTGISGDYDNKVKHTIESHKAYLEMMMPDALRVLANQLRNNPLSSQEKRLQTTVALEILDRQGSLPKISRTDVHAKFEHDFSSLDNVSKDILSSVDGPIQSTELDKSIDVLIKANNAFSQSKTLSTNEQEKAMKILENTKIEGPVN